MTHTLQIVQIVASILLVALVLLQRGHSDTGTLGAEGSGSFLQTRRGAERFIFVMTIIVAIAFTGVSLAVILLGR